MYKQRCGRYKFVPSGLSGGLKKNHRTQSQTTWTFSYTVRAHFGLILEGHFIMNLTGTIYGFRFGLDIFMKELRC